MDSKNILVWSAFLGGLSVVIGALGAHVLENIIDAQSFKSIETAVKYQFYHALLLFTLGLVQHTTRLNIPVHIYALFLFGVIAFSFSIYVLIFLKHQQYNYPTILALITPLGGVSLILGWLSLALHFFKNKIRSNHE